MKIKIIPLDSHGDPLHDLAHEVDGQVGLDAAIRTPQFDVAEPLFTITPKTMNVTVRFRRYGIGARRELQRLLGVTYLERHRTSHRRKR